MWAVLGADQGEQWSWLEREGDLGSRVGGLRSGSGRKVALARAGRRSGQLKWAVLGADQGEKWPWLEQEGDLGRRSGQVK